nr:hypothetical protein CFP56_44477 [Quercus suber]
MDISPSTYQDSATDMALRVMFAASKGSARNLENAKLLLADLLDEQPPSPYHRPFNPFRYIHLISRTSSIMGDPGLILEKFSNVSVSQDTSEYFSSETSCNNSTSSLPTTPEPSAEEIVATITTLCESLKVISAPICPTHPELFMCSCPDAVATHNPSMLSQLKRQTFCRLFDAEVLRFTTHAFDYDGSQEAHRIFVHKTGATPKHWLRDWLQTSVAATLFAPVGKQRDTIAALLDYWVLRTAQWRARYTSLRAAAESPWFEAEYAVAYPEAKEPTFSARRALDRGTLLACDECLVLKTSFCLTEGGLDDDEDDDDEDDDDKESNDDEDKQRLSAPASRVSHETFIQVSPMSALARGFGVRYHVWDPCHPDCPIMSPRRQVWAANWVAAELARRLGYADCWAGKGWAQGAVGGQWVKARI